MYCGRSFSARPLSLAGLLSPGRLALTAMGLALLLSSAGAEPPPSTTTDVRAFLTSITGEWVGTCKQSTDGEAAEDKYFHAVVKQLDADTFDTKFEYYRVEKGAPSLVGTASVLTTIGPDGVAQNKIKGEGTVLVNQQPKKQSHEMLEVLRPLEPAKLEGKGSGSIAVSNMPLGLGKNGKISDATTTWVLDKGILTIDQSLKAAFRVLFASKTFNVAARYIAERGTDVATLIDRANRSAARP